MRDVPAGELLWTPSAARVRDARLTAYTRWLAERGTVAVSDYGELWQWSVRDLPGFWASVWDFAGVRARTPYTDVLTGGSMPGTRWFPGATVNYAEHALAGSGSGPAIVFRREDGLSTTTGWAELRAQVGAAAAGLRALGVRPGDRVAGLLPNSPHAVVAFLATASLGAVWSSCSPEFGERSIEDRFAQISPRVLVAVDGYRYNGRAFDITDRVGALRERLPGLAATVVVDYIGVGRPVPGATSWDQLLASAAEPVFEPVGFEAPLWILYSSGTTGLPKAIVHSHGGILLEHVKQLALHLDLGPADAFFWFTTTGWMMWNLLVSGLLVGATVALYDGSPVHPTDDALWAFSADAGLTCFGTSAPYIQSCRGKGLRPAADHDLSAIRTVGSTGAPLPPEGFGWVYDAVGADLLLASVSGGTDVCTAFVGGLPTGPVRAGEIQCRALGAKVEAFDERGRSVVDRVGELVVTAPMPSMPIGFWNDPDGSRLRASYFDAYPGVWRHGDWVRILPTGSCVIYGRSDSTLNRGGVRMGTSEFYRVVEDLPEVADSLVVDTSAAGGDGELWLFVVPAPDVDLDDAVRAEIAARIRAELSPRHVPDHVVAVAEVPRTLNGKKCEVPVKRILMGEPVHAVVSAGALANPASLEPFTRLAGSAVQPR